MSIDKTEFIFKSRKNYMCDWCAEKINKGDSYTRHSGIYCGDFFTSRMHDECNSACNQAYAKGVLLFDDTWTPGDFKRGKFE